MEDDREMRVDEALPADSNGDRDRERCEFGMQWTEQDGVF